MLLVVHNLTTHLHCVLFLWQPLRVNVCQNGIVCCVFYRCGLKGAELAHIKGPGPVQWPEGLWPGYQEELLEIFRMIDDSSNGIIDFGKLLDLGKGVDASFTADKCASLLGRIDNDHNDAVTQSEFLEFFGKMMAPHTRASNDKGMVQIRRAECG